LNKTIFVLKFLEKDQLAKLAAEMENEMLEKNVMTLIEMTKMDVLEIAK